MLQESSSSSFYSNITAKLACIPIACSEFANSIIINNTNKKSSSELNNVYRRSKDQRAKSKSMTYFLSCLPRAQKISSESCVWNACERTCPRVNVNEQTDSLFRNGRTENAPPPRPGQPQVGFRCSRRGGGAIIQLPKPTLLACL